MNGLYLLLMRKMMQIIRSTPYHAYVITDPKLLSSSFLKSLPTGKMHTSAIGIYNAASIIAASAEITFSSSQGIALNIVPKVLVNIVKSV